MRSLRPFIFFVLKSAVIALKTYGVPLHDQIANSTYFYMSHAPHHPLELYALAASNNLYDLATSIAASTSSHLLSLTLALLTDEMARRIGPDG